MPFTTRIERPPLCYLPLEGGLDGLLLRATFSPAHPWQIFLPALPSDCFAIDSPRRAISPAGPSFAFQHHTFSPKGVTRLSFTARIGRAQFHRARSASKKDGLVTPYPILLRPRVARARETSSLLSLLYFTRNGFEFSPEAVVTLRRTKPFFPPAGTVAVILSLVC